MKCAMLIAEQLRYQQTDRWTQHFTEVYLKIQHFYAPMVISSIRTLCGFDFSSFFCSHGFETL